MLHWVADEGRETSEHEVDADHAGQLIDAMAVCAQDVGCSAKGALVIHTDVRRDAAPDQVVAQTQPQLDRAAARRDLARRMALPSWVIVGARGRGVSAYAVIWSA